jgi:hypothetical protein
MTSANQPSDADASSKVADQVDEAALAEAMRVGPRSRSRLGLVGDRLFGHLSTRFPAAGRGGLAHD